MKRMILAGAVLASALALAGCYTPGDRAAGGAVIGAGTGALLGAAATGRGSGALAGAAIGAASGAVIGAATTPPPPGYRYARPAARCAEWAYDRWGNPVCVGYYGPRRYY